MKTLGFTYLLQEGEYFLSKSGKLTLSPSRAVKFDCIAKAKLFSHIFYEDRFKALEVPNLWQKIWGKNF